MAWKRIEDRQLEWDLMQAGLLYVQHPALSSEYIHYTKDVVRSWEGCQYSWFSPHNDRKNYIQLEE